MIARTKLSPRTDRLVLAVRAIDEQIRARLEMDRAGSTRMSLADLDRRINQRGRIVDSLPPDTRAIVGHMNRFGEIEFHDDNNRNEHPDIA